MFLVSHLFATHVTTLSRSIRRVTRLMEMYDELAEREACEGSVAASAPGLLCRSSVRVRNTDPVSGILIYHYYTNTMRY